MTKQTTIAASAEPRLGTEQKAILESLVAHGHWSRAAGWVWSTLSRTQKLLQALEKHRLVETREERVGLAARRSTVYHVTPAGLSLVTKWRQERQQAKLRTTTPAPVCLHQHASGRICRQPASHGGDHEDAEGIHWAQAPSIAELTDPAYTPPSPAERRRAFMAEHGATGGTLASRAAERLHPQSYAELRRLVQAHGAARVIAAVHEITRAEESRTP